MSCWLWMDERFDTRLDGLEGAILMAWKHCGILPVTLLVNRVTTKLSKLADQYGVRLVVDTTVKGGGGSVRDLNRKVISESKDWFDTDYMLTFQDHAFPLRSGIEEYLDKWDYIAAPWAFGKDDWITRFLLPHRRDVGNGAFSLRSRNLCERTSYYFQRHYKHFPHCYLLCDDYFIGKTLPSWERNYRREVNIAPADIASRFALEDNLDLQKQHSTLPFGFHGPAAFEYLVENHLI